MLTIVIPNRNRNLDTVRRTLASVAGQCDASLQVVVVDYGSAVDYQEKLKTLVQQFAPISLLCLPVQGQLWQKTRAINIALKRCTTPFFMVVDMDMLFHPDFKEKITPFCDRANPVYFKVGILTKEESEQEKAFEAYNVKFYTNEGATGITLFTTEMLQTINGFDEFYHGWGAEDTDVHVRLRNAGYEVTFNNEDCLFLHQWHAKTYRSKESKEAYHSRLEKINHSYLALSRKLLKTRANTKHAWGVLTENADYDKLLNPTETIYITALRDEVQGLCSQIEEGAFSGVRRFLIEKKNIQSFKERLKVKLKPSDTIALEEVNNYLLETLISNCRNLPYNFQFDKIEGRIILTINFL